MSEYEATLRKKALGYEAEEVVEEYTSVDGRLELIKRKITTKHVPPDLTALKLMMENEGDLFLRLSDEELMIERNRLINELKEEK